MLLSNHSNFNIEAGTDEAGRGCLAGPVTAAAVILPNDFFLKELNDSKQLSEKTREKIRPIIETEAIAFHFEHIEPEIIDKINILETYEKFHKKENFEIIKSRIHRIEIVTGDSLEYFQALPSDSFSRFNFSNIFREIVSEYGNPDSKIEKAGVCEIDGG